jgi:histidinol dehydrogenase
MRIVALDETSRKDILADLLKRDPNNYKGHCSSCQSLLSKSF